MRSVSVESVVMISKTSVGECVLPFSVYDSHGSEQLKCFWR